MGSRKLAVKHYITCYASDRLGGFREDWVMDAPGLRDLLTMKSQNHKYVL